MSNVPPGVICSLQDYERSLLDHSISCLTRGQTVGLIVTVETGFLSLLAIFYVFTIIARNVVWRVRHMSTARLRIFHQPMDVLLFSLLLADSIQAVGMILSIKWIQDGKVEVGNLCIAQGIIKVFGATGVALSTLAIALYTFIGVWMMKKILSMKITTIIVVGIWISIAILAIVGLVTHNDPTKPSFMSPSPYWCWVDSHYLSWRLLGEYIWMWITLFFSLLVYVPLYLWMRGYIVVEEFTWWKCNFQRATEMYPHLRARRRRSLVMLAYPLVYCISIIPLSVVRWIAFIQESRADGEYNMPSAATLASCSIFGLSGFLNVILVLTTKPESGLFGQLMFISPARPPLISSDSYRDERSTDDEYRLGKLPSIADTSQSHM